MAVSEDYIANLYRDVLGREGSPGEIAGHVNNPGGEEGLLAFFLGSPEYTSQHGGQATWQDVGGRVTDTGRTLDPQVWETYSDDPQPSTGGGGSGGGGYSQFTPSGKRITDQWSGNTTINPGGNFGNMRGFDIYNFYDPNMQTLKYQVGRILADYPPTPQGLAQAMKDPRMKAAAPNAKQVDFDGIDFGDGKKVDVGQAFDPNKNTGAGWQWLTSAGAPAASSGGGGGGNRTTADLRNLFGALGSQFGGPGGPGIANGPLEQMGQDPLSQLITGGIADFLLRGGQTEFGQNVSDIILGMLKNGDTLNEDQLARRFESARELMGKGERTMMNEGRSALASRNLLSEPGIPQGSEIGMVGRVQEAIAPEFSRALRDAWTEEARASDARQLTSLQLAAGMSADQAKTFLAGVGEGTARQVALANIALATLDRNMAWNQFLAEFGLKRDTVLAQLQNGRVDDVMDLLNQFLALSGAANQGYI